MGWRPNRAFLEETGRKLKSTFGIPRITEKTRCHGSSAKHIYNPMTRGYQPTRAAVGHVARCQGSRFGAQDRSRMIQLVVPPSRPQQSQIACASDILIVIVSKNAARRFPPALFRNTNFEQSLNTIPVAPVVQLVISKPSDVGA